MKSKLISEAVKLNVITTIETISRLKEIFFNYIKFISNDCRNMAVGYVENLEVPSDLLHEITNLFVEHAFNEFNVEAYEFLLNCHPFERR